MRISSKARQLAGLAACMAMAACASTRPIQYSGLESASQLKPNRDDKSGRVPYDYSAGADWRRYSSVTIEPVAIYRGADNQFEKISEQDKELLAQYMRTEFGDELNKRFDVVNYTGPGTLRLKLTLTGAKTTPQFVGTVTKFDLAGGPYNAVQAIRGKEGALSGSVSYAVEVYDASANRLLEAYVAKQYPSAMNVKASLGALGASKVGIRKGAQDLVTRLN